MNLNQSQLITILEALSCYKGEMSTTPKDYNSIVEEVSKELLEKFNYETNICKDDEYGDDYIIIISDFGRDKKEVEEERELRKQKRKLRKWKDENHVKDLLEVATYLKSLINNFMYENILYRQDGFEIRSKFEDILQHVEEMVIDIMPFDVKVEIIHKFNEDNTVNVVLNFINRSTDIVYSEEEMKSIYVKDDEMTLHGISKYLENTRI